MLPAFLQARGDVAWQAAFPGLRARIEGVTLTARSRWWGKRWTVTSESAFPVPEPLLLFVSRKGLDHGFWRDYRIGDAAFDQRHFVYSDTPALLPLVIGPATRRAIGAKTLLADALTLYAVNGVSRVSGTNRASDETAIERHLEVHRALAHDHADLMAAWTALVDKVHGRAAPHWPPAGTLMNPIGSFRVSLVWLPRDEDSLRTRIVGQDGRPRARWTLREAEPFEEGNLEVGHRRMILTGIPSLPRSILEQLVGRGAIASIACASDVSVTVHGVATESQLATMVRVLEQVLKAADSGAPYR